MSDEATRELPPPAGATPPALPPPEDELAVDDDWPVRAPARGIRLAVPTAALVAVLLVAAGFWGGATLQKRHSSGSSGASLASAFANRLRAAGGSGATGATGAAGAGSFPAGGFGGFGGGQAAAATGTISVVDGETLYVLTNDGSLVKVTLDPSTSITRNSKAKAVGLRPGDSVVVQGSTATNGNVTASSVSATAPGVSSGGRFGGFPGGSGNG